VRQLNRFLTVLTTGRVLEALLGTTWGTLGRFIGRFGENLAQVKTMTLILNWAVFLFLYTVWIVLTHLLHFLTFSITHNPTA